MGEDRRVPNGNTHQELIGKIPAPTPGMDLPVLPERADRLLSILADMDAYVSEANNEPKTIYVSPGVYQVTGYTQQEVLKGEVVEVHAEDQKTLVDGAVELARTGRAFSCLVRIKHKQGHWLWIEISSLASYSSAEGGYQSISLNRDVTELVTAQRDLRESEERYCVVSEMSRDLITESTIDGQTEYVSPGVTELLGWTVEELISKKPYELVHPNDVDRLREITENYTEARRSARFEAYRIRAKNGAYLWFETFGTVYQRSDGEARMLAVSHNITEELNEQRERRELEEKMVSSQKLESLGVMAGGIAHDFNNLLTPILGEASLGLADTPEDSPLRTRLLKIQHAAERAASLTQQMLSYAGKSPLQLERLDLSHLVNEMGRLFESAVSGKTQLHFDLVASLPPVEADAAQVSQVVINLISNASESLPDGAGKITVRTGAVLLTQRPPRAEFAEALDPGLHVFVEVSDTGCGMDTATAAKIFDPFFSTKFTGRGLGLAAVAGIVRGHRGALEIETEADVGTVIRVLFPATDGAVARLPPAPRAQPTWKADQLVLVVDDDPGVRDLALDILSRVGLRVMTAEDGREGLRLFREHAEDISLVLLDRTMPVMGGLETFYELLKIRPDVKVLLVSGYSEERAAAELTGSELAGFLQKPFLPDRLIELVREAVSDDG